MRWLSDAGKDAYLGVAKIAVQNENVFSTFKIQSPMVRAVGIGDGGHAEQCYKAVLTCPEVAKNLSLFARNDSIGKPPSVNLKSGRFGFDTIRFAETVAILQKRFGDLSGQRIVEFGSNYGGLAYCMLTQWPEIESYYLLDFPEIQTLARKYLCTLGLEHPALRFEDCLKPADIFISEYALTELVEEDLYDYYYSHVKHAKIGLLIRCNIPDEKQVLAFLRVLQNDFTLDLMSEPASRGINTVIVGWR